MQSFAQVNEVYGTYFTDQYPARETVQVAALPKNVNIEISVIAIKP
jgi:2-iminobutanoate/2-iminopropanoate deaminase